MAKQKHLIALDLDGTLLTDKKVISPKTKRIVEAAMAEGHIVVIATGRPHRASINYYEELKLQTPMVNFNGAFTHHPRNKKWQYTLHTPMPSETAQKIIGTCYDLNVKNILAEVVDDVYLERFDQDILDIFQEQENEPPYIIGHLRENLKEDPTSLLIHPEETHIKEINSHLNDYHAEIIEHRKWGAPWNIIEVIKKGMNKAVGLDTIASYYGIPKERVIAFGDEDNDLEMIEYAGVGVAMGNAIDDLKSISKHRTLTNEQDGIGIFLEEYLKIKTPTH